MKQENEFLALVYGPPVYFEKMCILELRVECDKITKLLYIQKDFTADEIMQLIEYRRTFANRIQHLNKQYSI